MPDRIPQAPLSNQESLTRARERAARLIEQAHFNEAIKLIQELEKEVAGMSIASRFSATREMGEDSTVLAVSGLSPHFKSMTEKEYKRATILLALRSLKSKISDAIHGLEQVVLDIGATKIEG